jgi:hypothetical protein
MIKTLKVAQAVSLFSKYKTDKSKAQYLFIIVLFLSFYYENEKWF